MPQAGSGSSRADVTVSGGGCLVLAIDGIGDSNSNSESVG